MDLVAVVFEMVAWEFDVNIKSWITRNMQLFTQSRPTQNLWHKGETVARMGSHQS